MASKLTSQPFDWMGLLFLIVSSLGFILLFGSVLGMYSHSSFVAVAISFAIAAAVTCACCARRIRKDAANNWWPATLISGALVLASAGAAYLHFA
jgi:hypothetical protein